MLCMVKEEFNLVLSNNEICFYVLNLVSYIKTVPHEWWTWYNGPQELPGQREPKGDHGKRGMEKICKWLPDVVLQGFKENQAAC